MSALALNQQREAILCIKSKAHLQGDSDSEEEGPGNGQAPAHLLKILSCHVLAVPANEPFS